MSAQPAAGGQARPNASVPAGPDGPNASVPAGPDSRNASAPAGPDGRNTSAPAGPDGREAIRVLLVDDEPLVRSGLRALLSTEADIEICGEAGDGREAIEASSRLRPDVVVMDIRMPVMDGLEASEQILAEPCPPAVLVLTTFDSDAFVYRALVLGASGFLLKRASAERIIDGIRLAAERSVLVFPESLARVVAEHGHPVGHSTGQVESALTTTEQVVLRLVCRGLSNAEIADELVVSVETVRSHLKSLLRKLGVDNRTQAVIRAYETGFVNLSR